MADFHCFVVCEGPSDFAVINSIVSEIGQRQNKEFKATLIAPALDATSGSYERFGHGGVMAWCRKQAISRGDRGVFPFEAQLYLTGADLLLVHIDTDVAEQIVLDGRFSGGAKNRRNWCERGINMWLGINVKHDEVFYVLPTMQIETWFLATYDMSSSPGIFPEIIEDYELITDVEARLLALGYEEDQKRKGRIFKSQGRFQEGETYCQRLIFHLEVASKRCAELSKFIEYLTRVHH